MWGFEVHLVRVNSGVVVEAVEKSGGRLAKPIERRAIIRVAHIQYYTNIGFCIFYFPRKL